MRFNGLTGQKLAGIIALCSLSTACLHPASNTVDVIGNVVDEHAVAISGAKVCVGTSATCTTTDSKGNYTLTYGGALGTTFAVTFSADGFARQAQPVTANPNNWLPVILRHVGSITAVTLPAANQAPVNANVTVNGNTMVLTIPGGAMVDPNGNIATGAATVSLTYWHPLQALTSAPGPLLAEDPCGIPNNAIPLVTWGMADIEVAQNNALLNVAPGQHLTWTVPVPPSMQSGATNPNLKLPNLYSMNPNNGLWHYEGNVQSGALAYNANGNVFTASLPHLSAWNIDNDEPASGGGCVQGHVNNKAGAAAANTDIVVWFLGDEELKDWHTTTDGSGNYCINTPITVFPGADNSQYTHYFVSGADAYTDTDQCNPAPANCFNCTYENATAAYGWCSLCRYTDPADLGNTAPDGYGAIQLYPDACGAAQATVTGGTFCSSGGCATLNTATLSGGGSTTPPPPPPPCQNPNYVHLSEGQACNPAMTNQVCCPSTTLVCLDYLCVPNSD